MNPLDPTMSQPESNYPDLADLQRVASRRASYSGSLVISKSALVGYIQSRIYSGFSLPLLNQALKLYSRKTPGARIVLGSKKWNLNPAVVPDFLDWLTDRLTEDPNFIETLLENYRRDHRQGSTDYLATKGYKNYKGDLQ